MLSFLHSGIESIQIHMDYDSWRHDSPTELTLQTL